MCLFNYNSKFENEANLTEKEFDLLNQIYKNIDINNLDEAKKLTNELISVQSSQESINVLESAIESLNNIK